LDPLAPSANGLDLERLEAAVRALSDRFLAQRDEAAKLRGEIEVRDRRVEELEAEVRRPAAVAARRGAAHRRADRADRPARRPTGRTAGAVVTSKRSVSVRILGHEYRIRTEADPADLSQVARLVDETMERLRDRTGVIDSLDLAIMAALNLARDLVAERGARQEGESKRRARARPRRTLGTGAARSRARPLAEAAVDPLGRAKQSMRSEMDAIRRALSAEARRAAGESIARHVLALPEYARAARVAAYVALADEAPTAAILDAILASGPQRCCCRAPGAATRSSSQRFATSPRSSAVATGSRSPPHRSRASGSRPTIWCWCPVWRSTRRAAGSVAASASTIAACRAVPDRRPCSASHSRASSSRRCRWHRTIAGSTAS
jgi:cell division protein ZapA (FtsZ GTPase activity inhibitor)